MGTLVLCPDCKQPMTAHRLPSKSFMLFGHIEIAWWSDAYFCVPCMDDQDQENRRRMDDAAYDAGFEKGWEAAGKRSSHF